MVSQLGARHKPSYTLLTFYKFVDIPESELDSMAQKHLDYCRDIGLHGRIYLGTEGISATITGNQGQCWSYREFLQKNEYFKDIPDIDAKSTQVDGHQFARLSVKIRDEIVTMGERVNQEEVDKYHKEIKKEEFKSIIDGKNDEYVILDMRNDYEYRLGHFRGAIPAGTDNFREVPQLLEKYKREFAGKKVIFYCTGGIRCEKASVIMNRAGMDELYSLQGGVVKYVNEFNDGNWLGNLYTFDGRVSTEVGDASTHTTIGECLYTSELTDNCENCRYSPCNARLIANEKEYKKHLGFCSKECYESARLDGFVKDMSWDKFDYKATRSISDSISKIQAHLDRKLANIEWRYQKSQKEEDIVEC
ncbi:hypothetical protein H7169_03940 [Candidatus Gracilibacteria bacterium]|nr:hypothetical protein [Candidatus Gracilibacteria bacterium]